MRPMIKRLSLAGPVVLAMILAGQLGVLAAAGGSAGVMAARAATARAANASSACSVNPSDSNCNNEPVNGSGCNTGDYYVVGSVPLKNLYTGQSSWSYGYVQLWWSQLCQTNWGRVVINERGNWDITDNIFKQYYGGYYGGYQNVPPGAYLSTMIYANGAAATTHAWIDPAGTYSDEYYGCVTQYTC